MPVSEATVRPAHCLGQQEARSKQLYGWWPAINENAAVEEEAGAKGVERDGKHLPTTTVSLHVAFQDETVSDRRLDKGCKLKDQEDAHKEEVKVA